jgi:polyhydroxybutyrate depolymerase
MTFRVNRLVLGFASLALAPVFACAGGDGTFNGAVIDGGSGGTDGGTGGTDAGGGGGTPTKGCGAPAAATGYQKGLSLQVAGKARTYDLYLPPGYNPSKAYPLVMLLHGDGGTGDGIRNSWKYDTIVGEKAIVAFPDGANKTWADGTAKATNGDLAFLSALNDNIHATYCVDQSRVFLAGESRGAYFSNQAAYWLGGNVIRAVGVWAGGAPYGIGNADFDPQTGDLKPVVPAVGALIMYGDKDDKYIIDGAEKDALAHWKPWNSCKSTSKAVSPSPCVTFDGCARAVTQCKVPGATHALWASAPQATWDFFATF